MLKSKHFFSKTFNESSLFHGSTISNKEYLNFLPLLNSSPHSCTPTKQTWSQRCAYQKKKIIIVQENTFFSYPLPRNCNIGKSLLSTPFKTFIDYLFHFIKKVTKFYFKLSLWTGLYSLKCHLKPANFFYNNKGGRKKKTQIYQMA